MQHLNHLASAVLYGLSDVKYVVIIKTLVQTASSEQSGKNVKLDQWSSKITSHKRYMSEALKWSERNGTVHGVITDQITTYSLKRYLSRR